MYLKYNTDEVTWVSHEELVAGNPICGFWVDTDTSRLFCAYYDEQERICHHYFNPETRQWVHTKVC